MILWTILAAMAAAAAGVLFVPLLRRSGGSAGRVKYDLAVFRDQLAELKHEEAEGALTADQAAAARLEVERRILAAGESAPAGLPTDPSSAAAALPLRRMEALRAKAGRIAIVVAALVSPLAALALYYERGAPDLPGQPFAAQEAPSGHPAVNTDDINRMVEQLALRLRSQPGKVEDWALLGHSYFVMERYDQAAEAFGRAATLAPQQANLRASQGEALVMASDGVVTPAAKRAFDAASAIDAANPVARFYLGLHRLQAGDPHAALAAWQALADEAPKDAPWLADLNAQIAQLRESIAAGGGN